MLRPVPMTRALIVGPRDELEATIERLYDLKLLHIVDHKEGEEGLEIGKYPVTVQEYALVVEEVGTSRSDGTTSYYGRIVRSCE